MDRVCRIHYARNIFIDTTDDVAVTVLGFAVAVDIYLVGNLIAKRNQLSLGTPPPTCPSVLRVTRRHLLHQRPRRMGLVAGWRRRLEMGGRRLLLLSTFSTIGFILR
jgi:hypothetical protein